jgi:hypothetical protein
LHIILSLLVTVGMYIVLPSMPYIDLYINVMVELHMAFVRVD